VAVKDRWSGFWDFSELSKDIANDTDGCLSIMGSRYTLSRNTPGKAVIDRVDIIPGTGDTDMRLITADLVGRLVVVVTNEGAEEVGNSRYLVFDAGKGTSHIMHFSQNSCRPAK